MRLAHSVAFATTSRLRPDPTEKSVQTEKTDKNDRGMRYIVRVLHRRDQGEEIVGIVESVEDGARHAFIDRDELWAILMRVEQPTPTHEK